MVVETAPVQRAYWGVRWLAYRSYYRAVHENYDRKLLTTRKETPGGSFRSYELYNRHGDDEMLRELVEYCGPTDTVYDIGANVGVFSLALAAGPSDRNIVAIEPAPPVVDRLRANVRLNDLEDQIHVAALGLGDQRGTRPFYLSTYSELSGYDRASATRWEADVAERTTAPMRRLDDLATDYPAPDVLKIDVEGAGPAVLSGGRRVLREHAPAVFLETHEDGLPGERTERARDALTAAGYTIRDRGAYWLCTAE